MSWQLLTALSVLSLSISVILQRTLLFKTKLDPYAYTVVFQGTVGVLLMLFVLVYGFKLPGIGAVMVPAVISVIFFGVGHIIYAKTLQRVEASAFSVLFATQAVWIMLLGIFLFNESLTVLQVVGSALIFAAVLLLVKNFRAVFRDRGTLLGLLTGLMFGIAITAWSYVGRHTDGLSWAAISFVGTALVAFLVRPSTRHKLGSIVEGKLMPKLVLMAIFYAIGSVAMLFAYKHGTFAVVSPLRQTSIIVTTLLALAILPRERNRIGRKLLAAGVCLVGVLLVVI